MKHLLSGFASIILVSLSTGLLASVPEAEKPNVDITESEVSTLLPEEPATIAIDGHLAVTQPYSIRITTDSGLLGDDYQYEDVQNGIDNTIKKRALRFFSTYDLYKNDGTWDATAEFTWSSYAHRIYWNSYHVRGSNDKSLGYILTSPATMKDAKFYLQNGDQESLAAATLDLENRELQIYSVKASTVGVATLKKSINSNNEWLLTVSKAEIVDHRLIKLLSSIAIDNYFTHRTSFLGGLMADPDTLYDYD